ncbi:MAG: ABC-F family ATP-binding cassette domain-containing protein [Alphaproteobacteria bacterium]
MLQINDLSYRVGGRLLYEQATASIAAGWKVGVVGANGSGKSTLFRLIRGELPPEAGSVGLGPRTRVVAMAQDPPDGDDSLLDSVLAADGERAALLAELDRCQDGHRLAEIHTRLEDIEAYSAPARAAAILAGLGFDDAAQQRPCSAYSGGWRMRVALAAALFAPSDLMMLDEPSNHLDLEARLWLEGFLARYRSGFLLISHDRGLLDAVCTHILHLDRQKLTLYRGNFATFDRTRREKLAVLAAAYAKQQRERAHIQKFIDRFRYKASKARQAQSRIKALERMEPIAPVSEAAGVEFAFPQPEPLSPPLLTLEDASVGYGDGPPVLSRLNLRVDMDDRIGLLGANGNGKTTLVRLLCGELAARGGRVVKSSKLAVGVYAQAQTEALDVGRTPLDHVAALMPMATETRRRSHLGRFGIGANLADSKIAGLSGGERARLLFALMCTASPHILLLDEPTNHLDMDAREALVDAVTQYDGAIILVSHDPALLDRCVDRFWLVEGGRCLPFDGDLDDYRQRVIAQRRGGADARVEPAGDGGADRKAARKAAADARASVAPLRRAARDAEKEVDKLHARKAAIEQELADPALYRADAEKVTRLQITLAEVARALAAAEEHWLQIAAELEAAS